MADGMLNGRPVHAVPSSKKSKLKKISREELANAQHVAPKHISPKVDTANDEGTTVLPDEPPVAPKKQVPSKPLIETPDTTVLGMESLSGGLMDELETESESNNQAKSDFASNDPVAAIKQNLQKQKKEEEEQKAAVFAAPKIAKTSDGQPKVTQTTTSDPKPDIKLSEKPKSTPKNEKENTPKIITSQPDTVKNEVKNNASHRFLLTQLSSGQEVLINKDTFVVGKSKHSDFQIMNTTTVSRSHAIITIENNEAFLEDNNSKNGTSVDGVYLRSHDKVKLKDGALIRLSDVELKFSILER